MAHNFRLTGTTYVSKDGNDASAGTSPDLPKATLARYGATTTIIGCGVYKGAFTLTTNGQSAIYQQDGTVVINCTGTLNLGQTGGATTFTMGQTSQPHFITIEGNTNNISIGTGTENFTQVNFKNAVFVPTTNGGTHNFIKCNFVNITSATITTSIFAFSYSQIFNSTLTLPITSSFVNSYVDEATNIVIPTYLTTPSTQFKNCNFQGKFVVGGITYELKKDKAGTTINPTPAALDLVTIDATVYTRGNYSEDPLFLNISKSDFWSVASTSPNLFYDSTGLANIGNVRYAVSKTAIDTEFATGTITNLSTSSNDFVVTAGTSGNVVSLPIQIASIPQVLGVLGVPQALNYNSDIAKGTAENNNVTAVNNYLSASPPPVATTIAGTNPRRLTIEMRWSVKTTIPTVDADWDNNGYVTAGNYLIFERNVQPRVDSNGYGNGSPEFVTSGSALTLAKWVQFRITVRNGLGYI